MFDLFKPLQHGTADPLGRGIRIVAFRVFLFQRDQLLHVTVIFLIAHAGMIEHIIFIRELLQQGTKLFDPLYFLHGSSSPHFLLSAGWSAMILRTPNFWAKAIVARPSSSRMTTPSPKDV